MKHLKKIAGLLLAVVMMFVMSVTAMADTTYTITIDKNGSDIIEKDKPTVNETSRPGFVRTFESFVGKNWKSDIKLKSKKWTSSGKLDEKPVDKIQAILTVGNDGSVTVKYIPESIKDQTNQ